MVYPGVSYVRAATLLLLGGYHHSRRTFVGQESVLARSGGIKCKDTWSKEEGEVEAGAGRFRKPQHLQEEVHAINRLHNIVVGR